MNWLLFFSFFIYFLIFWLGWENSSKRKRLATAFFFGFYSQKIGKKTFLFAALAFFFFFFVGVGGGGGGGGFVF